MRIVTAKQIATGFEIVYVEDGAEQKLELLSNGDIRLNNDKLRFKCDDEIKSAKDIVVHFYLLVEESLFGTMNVMEDILLRRRVEKLAYLRDTFGLENDAAMQQGFYVGVEYSFKVLKKIMENVAHDMDEGNVIKFPGE